MANTVYLQKSSAKQMQMWTNKWINISVNAEEIAKHANEKGYVSLNISERKAPSQYGDTHSISIRGAVSDQAPADEDAAE